jgi:hypothetical protein
MSINDIFEITVINWDKHNSDTPKTPKGKIAYKHFFLESRYFDDGKIQGLTLPCKTLFIAILCLCGGERKATVRATARQLRAMLNLPTSGLRPMLTSLQSLQLVKWIEIPSPYIQYNTRREEKIHEDPLPGEDDPNFDEILKTENPKPKKSKSLALTASKPPDETHLVIAHYCRLWKERYGATPPISRKTAGQISNLLKDFSCNKTQSVISTYLEMNDSWFLKKRHDIGTMVTNMNAIAQFAATGKTVSNVELKHQEKEDYHKSQIQRILDGKV